MQAGNDRTLFLSTLPAGLRERAWASAIVGVSAVLFAIAVPYAGVPLTPVPAFVASYQSALAINDLITAVLLFSQFTVLRSWAMLLLASGYLFTALAAIVHGLTFPGLFSPTGLLGAGPETTLQLYIVWHSGFPLLVIAYALTKGTNGGIKIRWRTTQAIVGSVVAVCAVVTALAWFATFQHDWIPSLLNANHGAAIRMRVVSTVCGLSFAALLTLWFRRPHLVIDIWLMVVMCAWLFDIALSTILDVARFDLGFYVGRLYGLCAASFVLGMLLVDNVALQAKTAQLFGKLRRQALSEKEYYTERERLFSAVVESSNDAIIAKALDGTITAWNKAAETLFGYSAGEAVGRHISLIVPEDRRAELNHILARIGRGETIAHYETLRIDSRGRLIDVSLSISPVRSASGEIVGASKIARDITESKRTQHELSREIEERQRIFETSQDLILVTDTMGTLMQVSPSATAILGYRPEDMIGRGAAEFIHPDDLDAARAEMRSARLVQQKRSFEARYRHKDCHLVTLNWLGTWSEPAQRHFFIGRDLTEKREAEAQARQAQKMEAIGQLTGGVAHDFNNILTVITGTIGILSEAVADRSELASVATLIDEAAERGAQLTRHLLAFARKQPLAPRDIDVNALILEAAKLLRPTLGEHIEISPNLADDAWPALVDPSQLTTAILNLALNARDAMPDGGKLLLETQNVALDDGYASVNSDVAVGHYVMIAVSDTGFGISAANLDKVFDPFFTTKQVGKGTGLGLSMVFGFVKQTGGHVKIYSEEGHGTTVRLYLPRSAGAGHGAVEAIQPAQMQGGDETVLIVEDDPLVRKYVVAQVASLGYTTLEAANAAEALAIIATDTPIDLLFTDVIMPGAMNGRQLVDAALKHRPSLKTLFTSGYTENAIVHHGRLDAGVLLLAKPYRKLELAQMLRTALAG
ncbi:PAS domain S-box protein [Bradyrhizobium sp.]|uniref:PAS domain S-box protein n=1 Tax=Bradyrhizobium sp. TaxID=376 RepID=UPI003C44E647